MCGTCDFLIKPLPPHSADTCPLLLRCAYCNICGLYNAHFASRCPKRAIGRLSSKAHLSASWKNTNVVASRQTVTMPVFRILDHEETYKEYCITHNLTAPCGAKAAVLQHLLERGFQAKTYMENLDEHILPPPFEEPIESTKVVPMKRRLRKSLA